MPTQVNPPGHRVNRFLCLGCVLLILVAPVHHGAQTTHAQSPREASLFADDGLVPIDGRGLFVRCVGAGGPLVFLLHGLGGSTSEWSQVQDKVARHATVCAYDRAGEGRSDIDPGPPHSAEDASHDLASLLDALLIDEPVVLAGFSVGGLLARHFATTRPAHVASLVLIDATPPVWTAMNMSGAAIEPRIDALLRFSGVHPRAAERLDIVKASEEVFTQGIPTMPVLMLTSGVKSLSAGIAADTRSQLATRLQSDQARELDADHRIVAGCTHAMPADCPDDVVQIILDAVDDLRQRRGEPASGHADALLSSTPLRRKMSRE